LQRRPFEIESFHGPVRGHVRGSEKVIKKRNFATNLADIERVFPAMAVSPQPSRSLCATTQIHASKAPAMPACRLLEWTSVRCGLLQSWAFTFVIRPLNLGDDKDDGIA
jgi:hypothetical protein